MANGKQQAARASGSRPPGSDRAPWRRILAVATMAALLSAWQRLHSVMTTSARWGTIERADFSSGTGPDGKPMLWRFICWDKFVVARPHEMFDPAELLSPLP